MCVYICEYICVCVYICKVYMQLSKRSATLWMKHSIAEAKVRKMIDIEIAKDPVSNNSFD